MQTAGKKRSRAESESEDDAESDDSGDEDDDAAADSSSDEGLDSSEDEHLSSDEDSEDEPLPGWSPTVSTGERQQLVYKYTTSLTLLVVPAGAGHSNIYANMGLPTLLT